MLISPINLATVAIGLCRLLQSLSLEPHPARSLLEAPRPALHGWFRHQQSNATLHAKAMAITGNRPIKAIGP